MKTRNTIIVTADDRTARMGAEVRDLLPGASRLHPLHKIAPNQMK